MADLFTFNLKCIKNNFSLAQSVTQVLKLKHLCIIFASDKPVEWEQEVSNTVINRLPVLERLASELVDYTCLSKCDLCINRPIILNSTFVMLNMTT